MPWAILPQSSSPAQLQRFLFPQSRHPGVGFYAGRPFYFSASPSGGRSELSRSFASPPLGCALPDWLLGRNTFRAWGKVAACVVVPLMLAMLIGIAVFRITEIPATVVPESVRDAGSAMIAGEGQTAALLLLHGHL